MQVVFTDGFLDVAIDEARRLVRVRRHAETYPGLQVALASIDGLSGAVAGVDRTRYGIIVDLREATGRNDAPFESEVVPKIRELLESFPARAMIVRTATGRLQLLRIDRERKRPPTPVFTTEEEACAHLLESRRDR